MLTLIGLLVVCGFAGAGIGGLVLLIARSRKALRRTAKYASMYDRLKTKRT